MSLPHVYELTIGNRREGITTKKRDEKIHELETYVKSLNRQIQEEANILYDRHSQKEDAAFQTDMKKTTHFYYFIGRLNPPHAGHLAALRKLVQTANHNRSVPLILLGSGPKGERTLDNPISYELKSNFIKANLSGDYILKEMKSPAADVSQYIKEALQNKNSPAKDIQITHMAGDKDEDSVKLNFIKPFAYQAAISVANKAEVKTETETMPALKTEGTEMSATRVRKDAYRYFLEGSNDEKAFQKKYGDFYGEYTSEMYRQIVEPAREVSREQIEEYIETGKMTKATTTRKRKTSSPSSSQTKSKTKKSKTTKFRKTNMGGYKRRNKRRIRKTHRIK